MKAINDTELIHNAICNKYYDIHFKLDYFDYHIHGVVIFAGVRFHIVTDEGLFIIKDSDIVTLTPLRLPDNNKIAYMTPEFGELLTRLKEEKFQKIR